MKILITAPYNQKGRDILSVKFGEIIYKPWKDNGRAYNEDELSKLINNYGAEGLITEHDDVTANLINQHPYLQFIGVCRGTPSNVDLNAAQQNGIPVFYTPARNAEAVAELFIANVICFMRNTISGRQWLTEKNWAEGAHTSYLQFKGNELAGKAVGMIGFGAVGQRIAAILRSFPCKIMFFDPYIEIADADYQKASLEDVFECSDIVSIHLPVNEETVGMIDSRLFAKMKPDAIFVNTARASVVKRDDLIDVIESNKIRGAILDVFDCEPPDDKDYRLINHPNVLATPHTAGATHEVEDHHVEILNEKILSWASSKEICKPVDTDV